MTRVLLKKKLPLFTGNIVKPQTILHRRIEQFPRDMVLTKVELG